MNNFEPVIGLEVHIQLNTETKIFCSCPNSFGDEPNTNICPVCVGLPGVLPVFNQRVLDLGIAVSLGLNCRIAKEFIFERKNYFYPDLPKDYQISQYMVPLGSDGFIEINSRKIKIKRVHMEEDAGKLIHTQNGSLVDFNRAGVPLLEIVSEPDIFSAQEAYQYLNELKLTIQYIGASSCDMEKGFLRCDANVSLRRQGDKELGVKVEVKNMNSFKAVRDALSYEIKRQANVLSKGGRIYQETRLWEENKQKTIVMRSKEEAHDYRYFPEPDLVRFFVSDSQIENAEQSLPELPPAKRKKFREFYKLREKDSEVLISNPKAAAFFEQACRNRDDFQNIANWVIGPLQEALNTSSIGFEEAKIKPADLLKIIDMVADGGLNNIAAKNVLAEVVNTGGDISEIVEKKNLRQVSDESSLEEFARQAIEENPKAVKDFYSGKENAIMFLVGVVMRKSKGRANPKIVKGVIERRLKNAQS